MLSRVRRWRGARRVRCACPLTFAVALSPAPIGPSPPPALRTGTCGFPASGSPVGSCISHAERRFGALLAVPAALPAPVPRSCTASPARCLSPTRRQTCSRPDGTEPPFSPAPSLTHVMLRNSPPLHAGFVGKATPAGLRPSVIPPHLRPLSSTGITPRLQYYGPLRHPAGPACPSRGSGCRVHGTDSRVRGWRGALSVATLSIFHACRRHYPGGNRPVHSSLSSRPVGGLPRDVSRRVDFRNNRFEACSAFTRVPASAAWSREPLQGGHFYQKVLHAHIVTSIEPLWPLPAGTTRCWVARRRVRGWRGALRVRCV